MSKWSLDPGLYMKADSNVDTIYMDLIAQQDKTPVPTDPTKPKMTLVCGPSPFTMPRGWEFFLTSPYEGITYISTILHNAGYPVEIIDLRYRRDPLEEGFREILASNPDILGLATFEDNYPFVEEMIAAMKEARPSLPIVLGGSLVTSVPHVFMSETKADVACISEAEVTVLQVMEAYTRGGDLDSQFAEIRGIWYRTKAGEVKKNPPRGQTPNLNFLPRMNLSLWPQSQDPRGLQGQIIASHSRGCKMDCSFCYRTTPQLREKSPEKFREDVKHLKENYNTDFIFFVDLTFTSNKRRTLEICEVLKEFNIRWTCLTRCADVDKEVLNAMREAHSDIVLYGVESLSPEILKRARKGSTENISLRAMENTYDAGLRFGTLIIVGLPGETEESLEHVAEWAEANRHITRVKYLSAMPGTTVYREGLQLGIIKSEVDHLRWLAVEQALEHDEFLNYNGLSREVSRRAYKRVYDSYQPGPVMDFKHYPEHFSYYYPDSTTGWKHKWSSAGPYLMPGVEKYKKAELAPPELAVV